MPLLTLTPRIMSGSGSVVMQKTAGNGGWDASWGSKLPTGAYAAVSGVPKARSVAKACLARLALQAKIKNQYWP